ISLTKIKTFTTGVTGEHRKAEGYHEQLGEFRCAKLGLPSAEMAAPRCGAARKSKNSYCFLPSSIAPQPSGILGSGFLQIFGSGHADGLHLLRAKAQQRGNVAHLVELRIVLHVEGFNITAHYPGEDCLTDIHNLLRGM